MDVLVPVARAPVRGRFLVPASKSILQRVIVLSALADGDTTIETGDAAPPGGDVAALRRATERLGRWSGSALGTSRAALTLDLGLGATGFRLATALATLRLPGARTLVRGRPALLRRPHRALFRALTRLGGHVNRRLSGAFRVLGGGLRGGRLAVGCRTSSQHVTALLLIAPRLGGLDLELVDRPVSRPYLSLSLAALKDFGVSATAEGLAGPGARIVVPGTAPRGGRVCVEPDASAAAVWWAAAALTGGSAAVPGLAHDSPQADARLLAILVRMGARLLVDPDGAARLVGPADGLTAAGDIDLEDAPDLVPLLGALAASARGSTRIHGVAHARAKESDRIATTAAAIRALGGSAEEHDDGLTVTGGGLSGGIVAAAGDHRIALAFGALGLRIPGVRVRGAEAVAKSQPGFFDDLERAATGEPVEG